MPDLPTVFGSSILIYMLSSLLVYHLNIEFHWFPNKNISSESFEMIQEEGISTIR